MKYRKIEMSQPSDCSIAMAKKPPKKREIELELELEPDAWARFERTIDVVAKSPPQPKIKTKAKKAKSPRKKRR